MASRNNWISPDWQLQASLEGKKRAKKTQPVYSWLKDPDTWLALNELKQVRQRINTFLNCEKDNGEKDDSEKDAVVQSYILEMLRGQLYRVLQDLESAIIKKGGKAILEPGEIERLISEAFPKVEIKNEFGELIRKEEAIQL